MALNDVSFQLGQGGLGRPLPGEDFISGIIFYNSSPPSAFTSAPIQEVFQISDAEALGILGDYSDETRATASFAVTAAGASGDTVTIAVAEPNPQGGTTLVTIGTYARLSSDTTTAEVAAGIAAGINALTNTIGYTAAVGGSGNTTVTVTARKGLGKFLNTSSLSITISGTITTGSSTAFTGGEPSVLAVYHYHISEYFRLLNAVSGQGSLYVGFFSAPDVSGTYAELQQMQNYADGTIRQIAVYDDSYTLTTSNTSTFTGRVQGLQAAEVTLDGNHIPFSILYTCDMDGLGLSNLTDLSTLNSSKVSIVVGQDGAAVGWGLFKAAGKSISCIGATLGSVAAAAVSQDIAWVGKFNLSDGTELDTAAFSNGIPFRDNSISTGLLTQLDNYRYIFLRKFIGQTGTYFNDSHCAILQNSDYAYIENNRTIDKAKRGMYASLLPALNSPLTLNADGTLADTTISYLETLAEQPLQQMQRDGDLSNFQVTIDSTQNVLSTSTVKINALLQPMGVARKIQVTIGYTTSISS